MRLRLFLPLILLLALCAPAAAKAAPVLNLEIHHSPTHFAPGSTGQYWFDVENVGSTDTSGTLTLTIKLPTGLKRNAVWLDDSPRFNFEWSCPGAAGDSTVTCTSSEPIPRHRGDHRLVLKVDVLKTAVNPRLVSATVAGGGAGEAPAAAGCPPLVAACDREPTEISSLPAPFGILAESFLPDFFAADGVTPERQAGSHPELLTVPFDFNAIAAPVAVNPEATRASGNVRNLTVTLPPGFIGNPTAVGECTPADFTLSECPADSQVGRATVHLAAIIEPLAQYGFNAWTTPVYNLSHPRGAVADLAFAVSGNPIHIKASLDPANNYAIRTTVSDINESYPPFGQKVTIWGVPADHSHDSERCGKKFGAGGSADTSGECPAGVVPKPFISLPAQCESEGIFRLHHYDSWDATGAFGPEIDRVVPGKFEGCDVPRFEPEVEIEPTGKQANTPTGLDVHIKVAQNENASARATPPVKSTTVTLPEGMSFSPSFADGLSSCTLVEMGLGTDEPVRCPDSSRIGDVTLATPLLPKPLEGSMYLAAQGDNPFGSLFGLYLVLHDNEERGILVKIPGRIDVDEQSGRITTVFDDLPQFPFEDLTLKFRSGPRAPLVSPPSCGTQAIGVQIASWAQPQQPYEVSNTYQVTEGPNGTPCPLDPARRPFSPEFTAGTVNPTAGSFSTFLFRLKREDDEQELSAVKTTLPAGLLAKIAGIPFCPEEAIASISTSLGAGMSESDHPACPQASQIGSISVGLGAGPGPNYFPGKAYLAGPYKGAPLSLAIVAPGLAGPFDLGNVVVRVALRVNPETARVTAVSDPFPTILHGVILRVRDVRLRLDRSQTTINPTDCSPKSVLGEVTGTGGGSVSVPAPFQVGECGSLGFKPKLSLNLFGGTHRGSHPKFRATLKMPQDRQANIAFAQVALPHSQFLDQGHIGTICTRVQFAAGGGNGEKCPPGSVYGTVSAKSPLLDETLTGNVYLRSSDHLLPDMVASLNGKIDVFIVGRIDSVHGGLRNTFELIPDAPVETFTLTLAGGKKGLLVNSRNICKGNAKATVRFKGHNGDEAKLRPVLRTSCRKGKNGSPGSKGKSKTR